MKVKICNVFHFSTPTNSASNGGHGTREPFQIRHCLDGYLISADCGRIMKSKCELAFTCLPIRHVLTTKKSHFFCTRCLKTNKNNARLRCPECLLFGGKSRLLNRLYEQRGQTDSGNVAKFVGRFALASPRDVILGMRPPTVCAYMRVSCASWVVCRGGVTLRSVVAVNSLYIQRYHHSAASVQTQITLQRDARSTARATVTPWVLCECDHLIITRRASQNCRIGLMSTTSKTTTTTARQPEMRKLLTNSASAYIAPIFCSFQKWSDHDKQLRCKQELLSFPLLSFVFGRSFISLSYLLTIFVAKTLHENEKYLASAYTSISSHTFDPPMLNPPIKEQASIPQAVSARLAGLKMLIYANFCSAGNFDFDF